MAITNHERVGKAMDLLKQGLGPFVEREFKSSIQGSSPCRGHALHWRRSPNCRRRPSANGTPRRY